MSVISWLVSYHVLEIDSWHWGCSRTALYNWMAIQFIFIYIHVVDFFVPLLDFPLRSFLGRKLFCLPKCFSNRLIAYKVFCP